MITQNEYGRYAQNWAQESATIAARIESQAHAMRQAINPTRILAGAPLGSITNGALMAKTIKELRHALRMWKSTAKLAKTPQ